MTKRKQVKQGTFKPIHPFTSIAKEAAFWDTYSVIDEIDEGTLVGFHQANKPVSSPFGFHKKTYSAYEKKLCKRGLVQRRLSGCGLRNDLQHTTSVIS